MRCSSCGIDAGFMDGKCVKCGYARNDSHKSNFAKKIEQSSDSNKRKEIIFSFLKQRSQPVKTLELKSKYKGNVEEETRKRTDALYGREKKDIWAAKEAGKQYQPSTTKMLYTDIPGMSTFLKGAAFAAFLPIAVFVKEKILVEEESD